MATQNPTQSKVRRDSQEVALARGLQAQRQPGSRRTEHPDRISSLRIMSLPGIPPQNAEDEGRIEDKARRCCGCTSPYNQGLRSQTTRRP